MSLSHSTSLHDGWWIVWEELFLSRRTMTAIALALALALAVALIYQSNLGSIIAAWSFLARRHDFIKSNFEKTGRKMFTFKVRNNSVTAFKGVNARKIFFDNKSLSLTEGYKIVTGASPKLEDIHIQSDGSNIALFIKRIAVLLHRDRLSDVIPTLFGDIQGRMDSWGKQGTMNPFENVYDLVFQMTVRMASCRELASDLSVLTEFRKHYQILGESATPTVTLFPWFPGPAKRAKKASTNALFRTLWHYIEERKKAPVPSSDAIDLLLAQKMSHENIIQFILGVIFAGIANTGINACWVLLYISFHAHWKFAIQAEVHALLSQYSNPSEPLYKRLSMIPIALWEDALPTIELVIRETVRLNLNDTLFRRTTPSGGCLKVPGMGEVPSGGFMAYTVADVHMNPQIYTNPGVFDPGRFSPGREEDKREPYAYLGWGAGRHPCAGMKVAKLEMKMIVAQFVVGYEYDLVDSKGRISEKLPVRDYNDTRRMKLKGEPCFIRFKRVVE